MALDSDACYSRGCGVLRASLCFNALLVTTLSQVQIEQRPWLPIIRTFIDGSLNYVISKSDYSVLNTLMISEE
jgi:hypothetical protein